MAPEHGRFSLLTFPDIIQSSILCKTQFLILLIFFFSLHITTP